MDIAQLKRIVKELREEAADLRSEFSLELAPSVMEEAAEVIEKELIEKEEEKSDKFKLKKLLKQLKFELVDVRLGIEMFQNKRCEKIFFDKTGNIYEIDVLEKTKQEIEKRIRKEL